MTMFSADRWDRRIDQAQKYDIRKLMQMVAPIIEGP